MPIDQISVRALVHEAHSAQAAIHYHFGDMERLYVAASAAALTQAERWMAGRLAALAPLATVRIPPAMQAALINATIADWTGEQRRLAMAARHAPGPGWERSHRQFWTGIAEVIGLGAHAETIACYAHGEAARHLLVWNPVIDRALLEETTTALVTWLAARRFGEEGARTAHRALARAGYREPPPSATGERAVIAGAAADLLAAQGHAGVTFRAVAARAGVTLGKVVHLVGTKSELLALALHRLYEREALGGDPEQFQAQRFAPHAMLAIMLDAVLAGSQPVLAAYDEIERAIYNGADHAPLRGLVRAMEDPSGTWALTQLLGGEEAPPASLVAAFSAILRGVGHRAAHAADPPETLRVAAEAALRPFLPRA
ncbi:MAG: hypothetical protein NBV68_01830 [Erythrobacter sp.]|nr:hypothetical protein [Erythrobacter sp.]